MRVGVCEFCTLLVARFAERLPVEDSKPYMPHGKRNKIKVIDSSGKKMRRKLSWARKREAAGLGKFVGDIFVFPPLPQSHVSHHSPNLPPVLDWRDVPSFRASDSGQVGFLRYPHTGQESGSIEQRHPGLSRAGAGL